MPPRTRNFTLSHRLGHPRKRHEGRPVTPRDAATLILVRSGPGGPEILMGQRSNRAKFVPGSFVFPGGRLDTHDWQARPATPLAAPVAKMGLRGECRQGAGPRHGGGARDLRGNRPAARGGRRRRRGRRRDLARNARPRQGAGPVAPDLPRPGDHLALQPDPLPRPLLHGGVPAGGRRRSAARANCPTCNGSRSNGPAIWTCSTSPISCSAKSGAGWPSPTSRPSPCSPTASTSRSCATIEGARRRAATRVVFFLDIARFVPYMCFVDARNAPAATGRRPRECPREYPGEYTGSLRSSRFPVRRRTIRRRVWQRPLSGRVPRFRRAIPLGRDAGKIPSRSVFAALPNRVFQRFCGVRALRNKKTSKKQTGQS